MLDCPARFGFEVARSSMRLLALALLVGTAGPLCGGPLDSHPTGGPWSQQADRARHEVALSVLVRDMALSPDQAKRILGLVQRLDKTVAGLAAAGGPAIVAVRAAMGTLRDRVLSTPAGLPGISRSELNARRAWEQNVEQLEREVEPIRNEIAGLLTPEQQKTLRAFNTDRSVAALGLEDSDLDEWCQRLVGIRETSASQVDETVKEQLGDILEEAGRSSQLDAAMALVKEVRALSKERFDAEIVQHARRMKTLTEPAPTASPSPPEVMELGEAVNENLLDMRLIPVLEAYLSRPAPAPHGVPSAAPATSPTPRAAAAGGK